MAVLNLRHTSAAVVAFGALWYLLLAHLSQFWAIEPEYSYGWLVPFLSGYLFLSDWRSRPNATVPTSRIPRWIFCIAAFALWPTWLVGQANPDWRVISWLLAFETISICLCAAYLVGGRAWFRHFGFTVCLILTAVPWPEELHRTVIHGLTTLSTTFTVGVLNGLQIHAVQRGNVIELATGAIGIEEACSGIQSLQASVMLSLFLGQLYRGSILRRTALVFCAGLAAFACNFGRTLALSMIGAKQGIDAISAWHDLLGYAVLTVCFLLVWGIARVICGPLAIRATAAPSTPVVYPYRMIVGLGAWVLFTIVGTEVWYRANETTETLHWSFKWPVDKQTFAEIPITSFEAKSLLFDEGRGAEWTNEDSSHWVAYFFRWARGPSWSRILARGHRPEVCFSAAGSKLCEDHGTITVQTKGCSIPFHAMDFEDDGGKEYVFFCVWEDGAKNSGPRSEDRWSQIIRLRSVLLGQRNLGQQTLEIVISGVDSPKAAEAVFRREVASLIDTGTGELVADVSKRQSP